MVDVRLVEIRRVSTEEQARDDRSGLDRQRDANRKTAERVGAKLIEPPIVITDVCRENFIDTPEWRTIQSLISDPNVHIVVDMQDRIIGALEGIPILIACKQTHTLIFHSHGVTDPTTFAGQVLATFTALAAGNELHSIRHRAQSAKESRRRIGIFPSAAIALPTGIVYERTKGQKHGRWAYDDRISIVRDVYRLVVDEGLRNWREVARRAGATSGVTVRNMLQNPIYCGWWVVDERRQPGPTPITADGRRRDRKKIKRAPEEVIRHQVYRPKGSAADGREEAIIDEPTWEVVQTIVEKKRHEFHRPREPKGNTRFVYTGRIWCADCGFALWSKTRGKHGRAATRRDWYACKSTQGGRSSCSTKYLPRTLVNNGLDQFFTRMFDDERLIAALVEQARDASREDFSGRIATATKTLQRLDAQRQRLLDLYLDGAWARQELDARKAKLGQDRQKAEHQLEQLQRRHAALGNQETGFNDVLLAMKEFEFWQPARKRELLAKFVPRIEVSKRGVERIMVASALSLARVSPATWAELTPAPVLNDLGLVPRPFYKRADIKRVLGLTDAQYVGRVMSGKIPAPITKARGHKAWTEAQVREMIRAARQKMRQ